MTTGWEVGLLEARKEALARELGSQDYVIRSFFDLLADVREHLDSDDYVPNSEKELVIRIDRAVSYAEEILGCHKALRKWGTGR